MKIKQTLEEQLRVLREAGKLPMVMNVAVINGKQILPTVVKRVTIDLTVSHLYRIGNFDVKEFLDNLVFIHHTCSKKALETVAFKFKLDLVIPPRERFNRNAVVLLLLSYFGADVDWERQRASIDVNEPILIGTIDKPSNIEYTNYTKE